jgi:type II restriction enzyme
MELHFDTSYAAGYKSPSQIARLLTEQWVSKNAFCPNCGNDNISKFENNKPVADFYCSSCKEEFELKSKNGAFSKKINDGAYSTMIERIGSDNNPNFFFLTYSNMDWRVNNFIIVPKFYFIPGIIERRSPLKATARRACWTGCNILLDLIPKQGRLFLIKDSREVPREDVLKKWSQSEFLKTQSHESRGWLVDIMYCVGLIPQDEFTLDDMYVFESLLQARHPQNNFVKDKIRQQLQFLRDKGMIEFVSRGVYKKI